MTLPVPDLTVSKPSLNCTWTFAGVFSTSLGKTKNPTKGVMGVGVGCLLKDYDDFPGVISGKVLQQICVGSFCDG